MENPAETGDKSPSPIVPLDGTKAKKIREAKKLTQLYVASVVGVTTDTISRWENNRYPSIKRDNAEKLASALEVELAEILQQEGFAETTEEPSPPLEKKGSRRLVILLVCTFAVAVTAWAIYSWLLVASPVAVRRLPHFGAPGEIIPVRIEVSRKESGSKGFIVKERLPSGWRLVSAFPSPAAGEASADEIKWFISGGTGPVTVSYTVQIAPAPLKTDAPFSGKAVVHVGGIARTESIGGDRTVKVAGVHWADQNGDGVIDDNEIMPAYYLTEEMKGLGLDWKAIETIWSGKGYRWDPGKRDFVVVK
ncbi:MAG: XRE family transcriptional [Geobacteraceae bacterium]|nr:MAG: XRE family transcriptional [Geobacteraceae bacterium]